VQALEEFYCHDDNSRLTSGKKETVTKNKRQMQKRFLTDTMLNAHEKFCAENPSLAVGYSTFARQRPFWVRIASEKDRQTCLYKIHDNIQMKAGKLFQLKMIDNKNPEHVWSQICCDIEQKVCMYRQCEDCKDRSITFLESDTTASDQVTVWN
jgi:hypothetical protein